MTWTQHPLSAAFPAMQDEEVEGLLADIKENGLREPVVMYQGMVLDGWHRVQMCGVAGVEIRTREFPDSLDPKKYVLSKNLHRRSLTASQRAAAVVAANAWAPSDGWNQHSGVEPGSTPPATNEEMAAEAGVTERTITDAKTAHGAGLGEDVKSGKKSAKQAASEARGNPKEKKLTETEKLKAQLLEAKDTIAQLEESIDNLTDEVRLSGWAEAEKTEQIQELEKAQFRIRTLESQVRQYQNDANEWKKEALALRKKVA